MAHPTNSSLEIFCSGFYEDELLRSRYLRHLFLTAADPPKAASTFSMIPKVLIRFWDDAASIPADVQQCLDSWEGLRAAGFTILTFDDRSAAAYVSSAFGARHSAAFARCGHPAMRSDYFRLCFISKSGGFYVDADDVMTDGRWPLLYADNLLKVQPLCYDIPSDSMVDTEELWNADLVEDGRIFYVNNNPLVAPPAHPIVAMALERATKALLTAADPRDIQSTTGPGNLTAVLAAHARSLELMNQPYDFEILKTWDQVGETRWSLGYRADERNWRNVNWR